MDKYSIWLQEISQLEDKDLDEEIRQMNKDIHNIELRIFAHKLIKQMKEYQNRLIKLSLENIELYHKMERGE